MDTDSSNGHNESLRGCVYPMIAQELIRRIIRGSPFHSLSYHNHLRGHSNAATPLVNIEFQTYFLNTANITHVETKKLNNKNYVCNLRSARSSVLAGIDALITNT
ncbi:hypothetical protein ACT4S8_21235 [Enterobacter hormaechei]|uniref:hypothetical protein n=1 Tax=Enterobacter hormaechei TaxID=158836 RepID=UPI0040338676